MKGAIYISGPMSGIEGYNFDAFNKAASVWRNKGWHVVNPAEGFAGRTDLRFIDYMRVDVPQILFSCESVALLPNWNVSKRGVAIEVITAMSLGYTIYNAVTCEEIPYKWNHNVLNSAIFQMFENNKLKPE